MRICVVGTGYVGLVAGACFSDSGNHVTCLDVDAKKISSLKEGKVPIFEPGLDEIIHRNVKARRLSFTTDAETAIGPAKVLFIAVGTPSSEDGSLDLKFVLGAAKTIKEHLHGSAVVVLKSTVPVGTADKVRDIFKGFKHTIDIVSNPEFLKEGTAIDDFLRPERVVIGTDTENGKRVMGELYAPYLRSGNPIFFMSNRSAELAKYAANSFLAMKISFINDLAMLSEKTNADIREVRNVLVTDSRIGKKFLYPGCGYGGSCFPKDVKALIKLGKDFDHPLEIFEATEKVNEIQKKVIFNKMTKHFGKSLRNKTFAIWGLAFKPMTDDMREAPSVDLINLLLDAGAHVRTYDPVAMEEAKKIFANRIEYFNDAYETVKGCDALALMTEWNEFRSPDFDMIKKDLKTPVIFDGRNLYEPQTLRAHGFQYYCIGTRTAE